MLKKIERLRGRVGIITGYEKTTREIDRLLGLEMEAKMNAFDTEEIGRDEDGEEPDFFFSLNEREIKPLESRV
jgi:hypothetical protein